MGLLASGDVKLLSDKWRSTAIEISSQWRETAVLVALSLCVTALGIVAFVKLGDFQMILGTLGLLFVINRKAVGLNMKKLKKVTDKMEKGYLAEGKMCKGGVNEKPTTGRPEIRPKGQQPKGEQS